MGCRSNVKPVVLEKAETVEGATDSIAVCRVWHAGQRFLIPAPSHIHSFYSAVHLMCIIFVQTLIQWTVQTRSRGSRISSTRPCRSMSHPTGSTNGLAACS